MVLNILSEHFIVINPSSCIPTHLLHHFHSTKPEVFPKGSDYISLYFPTQVTIQIFSVTIQHRPFWEINIGNHTNPKLYTLYRILNLHLSMPNLGQVPKAKNHFGAFDAFTQRPFMPQVGYPNRLKICSDQIYSHPTLGFVWEP